MFKYPILLLFIFAHAQLFSQSAADYFNKAKASAESGNKEAALEQINAAITLDPENLVYKQFKSGCYFSRGDFKSALSQVKQLENEYPDSSSVNQLLANYYAALLDYERAIEEYEKAIEKAETPRLKHNYNIYLAGCKLSLMQYREAYTILSKEYAYDSSDMDALNNMAHACSQLNMRQESFRIFMRMLTIDSTRPFVWINLGMWYQEGNEHNNAIRCFNRLISMYPNDPYGYSNRATSELELGETRKALKDINHSIELKSTNAYAYWTRAKVWLKKGNQKKACEDLNTAEKLRFTALYGNSVQELKEKHCR